MKLGAARALLLIPAVGATSSRRLAAPAIIDPFGADIAYLQTSDPFEVEVPTSPIPQALEVCLLFDETGSYHDDLANLQVAAHQIFDDVTAASPGAKFGLSGFRDMPETWGCYDDWVYRNILSIEDSPDDPIAAKDAWTTAINNLSVGGGCDGPEGQYDAIVSAITGWPYDPSCGWSTEETKRRVLIVSTDAPFSNQNDIENNHTSTVAAIIDNAISFIGLKAYAGSELDYIALDTGGVVVPLRSDGSNVAAAIIDGLSNLPVTVTPTVSSCDCLSFDFSSETEGTVTSGQSAAFNTTITVVDKQCAGVVEECVVEYTDSSGVILATQEVVIEIPLSVELLPASTTLDLCETNAHSVSARLRSEDTVLQGLDVQFQAVHIHDDGDENVGGFTVTTDVAGAAHFTLTVEKSIGSLGSYTFQACTPLLEDHAVVEPLDTTFISEGNLLCKEVSLEMNNPDPSPPKIFCSQGTNPGGSEPPSDANGFWKINVAECIEGTTNKLLLEDTTGYSFGEFDILKELNVKYTQAPGGKPSVKVAPGEVDFMIKGSGDLVIKNFVSNENITECHVPPDNNPFTPVLHDPHVSKAKTKGVFAVEDGHHFLRG